MMKKAIIWDLLGTLGGNSRTLISQDFTFFEEAIPALRKAQANGYLNIIVTNQSHINHGRMTQKAYQLALEGLVNQLDEVGIEITAVYTCPHTREEECHCKKPQSFLVETAVSNHQLEPSQCYIVGDSGPNDLLLAKNAQMRSILVLTGDGVRSLTEGRKEWQEARPTHIARNSLDAVDKIIQSH